MVRLQMPPVYSPHHPSHCGLFRVLQGAHNPWFENSIGSYHWQINILLSLYHYMIFRSSGLCVIGRKTVSYRVVIGQYWALEREALLLGTESVEIATESVISSAPQRVLHLIREDNVLKCLLVFNKHRRVPWSRARHHWPTTCVEEMKEPSDNLEALNEQ